MIKRSDFAAFVKGLSTYSCISNEVTKDCTNVKTNQQTYRKPAITTARKMTMKDSAIDSLVFHQWLRDNQSFMSGTDANLLIF